MPDDSCKHSITSVVESRTFVKNGREWKEEKLKCVDCLEICETNIH